MSGGAACQAQRDAVAHGGCARLWSPCRQRTASCFVKRERVSLLSEGRAPGCPASLQGDGAVWAACGSGTRQEVLLWGFSGASLAFHEVRPYMGRRGVTSPVTSHAFPQVHWEPSVPAGPREIRRSCLLEHSAPITEKACHAHPSFSQNALSRMKKAPGCHCSLC